MSKQNPKAKKPTGFSLADMVGDMVERESTEVSLVDPITFLEAEWGLGMGQGQTPPMFPVQRFIVKAFYGMPFDDSDTRDIVVRDQYNEKVLHVFNELEFFEYLWGKGWINKEKERLDAIGYTNLQLVVGRRGSKTSIVSFITCYELYTLLSRYSPQEYFRIMPDDLIEITSISTNETNAKNLFDRVVGNLSRSKFFRPYMFSPNQFEVFFQTQRDIDLYGNWKRESLRLRAAPCSGKGLRGPNNVMVIFDEAAFFFKDEGGGKGASDKSDKAIYDAATPSIAGFAHPDGRPAGREIMISSPADRSGLFYETFERSFDPESNYLMLKMPTWVMNPSIASSYLKGKYKANPKSYICEFGAEFSDQLFGFFDDPEALRSCVDANHTLKERTMDKGYYFLGFDIGFKQDGTAFSVVKVEPDISEDGTVTFKFYLVHYEVHYPWDYSVENFEPDQVVDWIKDLYSRFPIRQGLGDQYYEFALTPMLQRKGIKNLELRKATTTGNSELYQNLLSKVVSGNVVLPPGNMVMQKNGEEKLDDDQMVKELLTLQAIYKDKYNIQVSAPKREGFHDDLSDSFARAVLCATEAIAKGKVTAKGYSTIGSSGGHRGSSRVSQEMSRALNNRSLRANPYQASNPYRGISGPYGAGRGMGRGGLGGFR